MTSLRRTPLAPDALDAIDRAIINRMQDGLPLVSHPFAALANDLGLDEDILITRIQAMREIGAISQELNEPVRVLYFSNAEQFFTYTPQFVENVRSFRTDERSIVLRTFRARGATYPARDRWHYVVHPMAGFLERLGSGLRRSRELEIEIVARRRARGAAPGFTQLER